ncbi:unnamed protein product [Sympodiomycopsis kandeliae]
MTPSESNERSALLDSGRPRLNTHNSSSFSNRSAGRRPSRSSIAHVSRSQVHESSNAPLIPAQGVDSNIEHDLHDPRWGKHVGRPNVWARFRHVWREELAEFLGTFFILLFGISVECQVNLHYNLFSHPQSAGDFNSQRFAWAVGVASGVWVAGGISGAHLNPTVTIALWLFRGFPGHRVAYYILAQVLGGAAGAAVVYSNYFTSIALKEGGPRRTVLGEHATAGLFVTFPQPYLSWYSAAWSEALASAVLVAVVFALGDKKNLSPPKGTMPIAMFLLLVGIGAALGINTGYAINFARDFGPRLFLYTVGYPSTIFTHNSYWAFYGPGLSSVLGGLLGGLIYDAFIYTGTDSPLNRLEGGRSNPTFEETQQGSALLDTEP